jgi:hypothetical protein
MTEPSEPPSTTSPTPDGRVRTVALALGYATARLDEVLADPTLQVAVWALLAKLDGDSCTGGGELPAYVRYALDALTEWNETHSCSPLLAVLEHELEHVRCGAPQAWAADRCDMLTWALAVHEASFLFARADSPSQQVRIAHCRVRVAAYALAEALEHPPFVEAEVPSCLQRVVGLLQRAQAVEPDPVIDFLLEGVRRGH